MAGGVQRHSASSAHGANGPLAVKIRIFLSSTYGEALVCSIVLANLIVIIIQVDHHAYVNEPLKWASTVNKIFSCLYAVEIIVRAYAYGRSLLSDPWAVLDVLVVAVDVCFVLLEMILDELPSPVVFRLVRMARLSRSKKIVDLVPEFHIQVQCLLGAIRPICWGLMFILFLLIFFGTTGVMLIHPIVQNVADTGVYGDCERCRHAFGSTPKAMLTLTQTIITGDSWGEVAVPVIEHNPASVVYFLLAFTTIALTAMNTILAVVVDSAGHARSENDALIAAEKEQERQQASKRFADICAQLDDDGSGNITREELHKGVRENEELATLLQRMEIGADEIDAVWAILDSDMSGTVEYNEFADQLYSMRNGDSHTTLVFIKHYIQDIRRNITDQMDVLKLQILTSIHEALKLLRKEEEELQKISQQTHQAPAAPAYLMKEEPGRLNTEFAQLMREKDRILCVPSRTAPHEAPLTTRSTGPAAGVEMWENCSKPPLSTSDKPPTYESPKTVNMFVPLNTLPKVQS